MEVWEESLPLSQISLSWQKKAFISEGKRKRKRKRRRKGKGKGKERERERKRKKEKGKRKGKGERECFSWWLTILCLRRGKKERKFYNNKSPQQTFSPFSVLLLFFPLPLPPPPCFIPRKNL